MSTFERMVQGDPAQSFALYQWNMRISSAFLLPLHVCEITVRNAVAEALTRQHGERWPWQPGWQSSLPGGGASGYNARDELRRAAAMCNSASSVVATLRFAFWQHMFTRRFDRSLWHPALHQILPGARSIGPVPLVRSGLHADLQQVRLLRNRIAHHEPVFTRDLEGELDILCRIVGLRCPHVAQWMRHVEQVTPLLLQCPVILPQRLAPPVS